MGWFEPEHAKARPTGTLFLAPLGSADSPEEWRKMHENAGRCQRRKIDAVFMHTSCSRLFASCNMVTNPRAFSNSDQTLKHHLLVSRLPPSSNKLIIILPPFGLSILGPSCPRPSRPILVSLPQPSRNPRALLLFITRFHTPFKHWTDQTKP